MRARTVLGKCVASKKALAVAFGLALMGAQVAAGASPTRKIEGACRREVFEGEVRAGESFVRPIGRGLEVRLEALSWGSGWILRIWPQGGLRGAHDYAELATPPYGSVSPLLLSTDFSFRAQDVVAWNPRHFRFIATAHDFSQVLEAYTRYSHSSSAAPDAGSELATKVSKEPDGTLQILDARLIPGMANQAGMAAMVASHFSTTAHTLEEQSGGKPSPLGKVTWLRFRIGLDLPRGFIPVSGIILEERKCP